MSSSDVETSCGGRSAVSVPVVHVDAIADESEGVGRWWAHVAMNVAAEHQYMYGTQWWRCNQIQDTATIRDDMTSIGGGQGSGAIGASVSWHMTRNRYIHLLIFLHVDMQKNQQMIIRSHQRSFAGAWSNDTRRSTACSKALGRTMSWLMCWFFAGLPFATDDGRTKRPPYQREQKSS